MEGASKFSVWKIMDWQNYFGYIRDFNCTVIVDYHRC